MNTKTPHNIERFSDKYHPKVFAFRKSLLRELGASESYLELDMSYKQTLQYCEEFNIRNPEEVWKYGLRKWRNTHFANILGYCTPQGDLASLSGCEYFSEQKCMRVSMHLYTLESYRSKYRNIQFDENGFFATHLAEAKSLKLDYIFFTVYPHNKVLQSHIKNLAYRKISPGTKPLLFVNDLIFVEQAIIFKDVAQYFFIYPINDTRQFYLPAGCKSLGDDFLVKLQITEQRIDGSAIALIKASL